MNRSKSWATVKFVFFFLLSIVPTAFAQGGAKPASETSLNAVQAQVLVATQKTAELAIEQNKRSLEQTQKIAEQAILAAKASNEHIKEMFTLSAILLGILGGAMTVLGYREFRILRKSFKKRLENEAKSIVDQVREDAKLKLKLVSRLCIEISNFSSFLTPIISDKAKVHTHSVALFAQMKLIEEEYAVPLEDQRTISWIHSIRAVVYYYLGLYQQALRWQKEACKIVVDHTRFDRERNLACIAAKVFDTTNEQSALELSVTTLNKMREYVTPDEANKLLGDDDLKSAFNNAPQIKADLQATASSGNRETSSDPEDNTG